MMKCDEISDWIGLYHDMPEDAPEKLAFDEHIRTCECCAEELRLWDESAELIRLLPTEDIELDQSASVSAIKQNVMGRIYAEESWYMPAARRSYAFTASFKRRVAGVLAGVFALFTIGLLYTLYTSAMHDSSGFAESASAFSASHRFTNSLVLEVPVASLSDPFVLQVSPTMPAYWIALSLYGLIMTLLILNWFARVRK